MIALMQILDSTDFAKPTTCATCPLGSELERFRHLGPPVSDTDLRTYCCMLECVVEGTGKPVCTHRQWADRAKQEAGLT